MMLLNLRNRIYVVYGKRWNKYLTSKRLAMTRGSIKERSVSIIGDGKMAYEIDFIGVGANKATKDADAICLRWKNEDNVYRPYTVGIVDGGFEAHGEAMVQHMNEYYFDDIRGNKDASEKVVDFVVVTHPHQDHTAGIKAIMENFFVRAIYMNRPWLYAEELIDYVHDGRITIDSLERRIREENKTIMEIEKIAEDREIPIKEALQGTSIEGKVLILSPSKEFYLDLLAESPKTPVCEENAGGGLLKGLEKTAKQIKDAALILFESWTEELLREEVSTTPENEASVVLRGIVDGEGFMLTGDAGIRALTEAMEYMEARGEDPKAKVSFFQIPHHGSRHNISPSILDRMLGKPVKKGESRHVTCVASVAEGSDHPLKMVTNAFIRRGTSTYKTDGDVLHHRKGDMPDRGWTPVDKISFSQHVESWED